MKNGKYQSFKQNEFIMKNISMIKKVKKTILYLIIIHIVIQNISYTNSIKIYGSKFCIINLNGISLPSTPNECVLINNGKELNCTFESSPITINLGTSLTSASNMFKDCKDLTSINLSSFGNSLKKTDGMFQNCVSLESINFGSFATSNVVNMSHMFYNCSSLRSLPFNSNFQTTSVIDMSYMFTNCSSLENLNLQFFNTGNLKNMSHMFDQCSKLKTLAHSFDTSSVENMEYMFSKCIGLDTFSVNFDFSSVTTMESMFKDCSNLNSIHFSNVNIPSLINMGSMFQSCSSLTTIDLSDFDTTSVLFMNDLFHDCISLNNIKISNFKTEGVIRMESMFENCASLTEIDLTNFYTPSVRQIYNLFSGCTSATQIKIPNFDTFQITNFANLFYNCHSLNGISLGHFVTKMASDMNHMFYNCSKITNLDLSKFNTERVLKMNSMFDGCSSLTVLKLNNFQNTQVLDMGYMFHGCSKLSNLNLNNFFTDCVKNMNAMFSGCSSLITLDLTKFKTENVINMNSMFNGCSSLTELKIIKLDTSNVIDMSYMFYECSSLTSLELSNFKTHNTEKIDSMFYNCKSLKSLSLTSFNTSKIKSMKSTFHGCTFIEILDLSHFKTNNVIYMDDLFNGCSSLIRLDISNFDVSKVISMGYMFHGCKSITSLNLPNIKALEVTNTSYMFAGCSSLMSLNLTNFDTKQVTSMDYMFSGCTYLRILDVNKWNTTEVLSMDYMFSGCASLTSLSILDFDTPKLESTKGMFYGCSSLEFLNLSYLNTSYVTNMAYMFYKASSLKSLEFYTFNYSSDSKEVITYFQTPLVENMKYMFAYCSDLEYVDLSYFDTSNVEDMSFMFTECTILTSANLSSFTTPKLKTMEYMFYKCLNLSYINLANAIDTGIDTNNILTDSLLNMVFCINKDNAKQINDIIDSKKKCSIIYCDKDYVDHRKKLIVEEPFSESNICIDDCESQELYYYLFRCYHIDCPNGSYHEEDEFTCYPDSVKPDPCTIQKVLVNNCTMDLLKVKYNDTKENKIEFIDDLKTEIKKKFTLPEYILQNGIVSKTIFNITYQFTTLSNKNIYDNLTYIDIQDCENFLKKQNDIDENEELIMFKIEYFLEEFKIPNIEYIVYTINGKKELNISECNSMNFIYSYPVEINETEEYKYNPNSEYNNEICLQFTTEYKTDIILFDRRDEFNEYNLSLCENNCRYIGYENQRARCECPVKDVFNQFLLEEDSVKDNLIYRFHDNHLQSYNFGVIKCFKIIFSKNGFNGNYASITYLLIIILNIVCAVFFCIKGYKSLYSKIQNLAEGSPKNKNKKKSKFSKKDNIITTGNNPPPKIKGENIINDKSDKKIENSSELGSKINAPSSLIDSKNIFKKEEDRNLSMLNKFEGNKTYIFEKKSDMEMNMLPYSEALKRDTRSFIIFYSSFLKTRQLLVCIFLNDNNSFIIKLCLLLFVVGICLGINTFFFKDELIQKIYKEKGNYTIMSHISNHIVPIIISTFVASVLKSIMFVITLTDVDILEIRVNDGNKKEEKINKALIKVTSKSTLFFIINFILMLIFWVYAGTFCAIFKNSQLFLIVSAGISVGGVLILPVFYCLFTAGLRKMTLSGGNKECLYKFSQFLELL